MQTLSAALNTGPLIWLGLPAVGALAGLLAWNRRRLRVTVTVRQVQKAPVYIHRMEFPEGSEPGIRSVGVWVEVDIHNHGNRPVSITAIENADAREEPEPIIGCPVGDLFFPDSFPVLGEPIELPLTLDGHHGQKFFVLSKTYLLTTVGRSLYKVFGTSDPEKLRQNWEVALASVNANAKPGSVGVGGGVMGSRIASLTFTAPLLRMLSGTLVLEPKFGSLSPDASFAVIAKHPEAAAVFTSVRPVRHSVEIVLAGGKRIVRHLQSGQTALWMLDRSPG